MVKQNESLAKTLASKIISGFFVEKHDTIPQLSNYFGKIDLYQIRFDIAENNTEINVLGLHYSKGYMHVFLISQEIDVIKAHNEGKDARILVMLGLGINKKTAWVQPMTLSKIDFGRFSNPQMEIFLKILSVLRQESQKKNVVKIELSKAEMH